MTGPSSAAAWTMPPAFRPQLPVLIIEARYYEAVGEALLNGALAELAAHGVDHERVDVPGALEIPQVLAAALSGRDGPRYSGAVLLGCVIRGETAHYDIVCNNANHWSYEIAVGHAFPIGNAILTVDTEAQAMTRATGFGGDGRSGKGADAVRACLKLIAIKGQWRAGSAQ